MQKKTFLFIIIVGIVSLLTYLGYGFIIKTKEKNAIGQQIRTIPEFEILALNKKPFSDLNLKSNLNTVFIYFNSECDLCQYEAKNIKQYISDFNKTQIVFVSSEPIDYIVKFSQEYNFNEHSNVIFLHDTDGDFSKLFNIKSIPYLFIYDKDQKLIKKHKGQLNANSIIKALNQ